MERINDQRSALLPDGGVRAAGVTAAAQLHLAQPISGGQIDALEAAVIAIIESARREWFG